MKLRTLILTVAMGFWLAASAQATTMVRMSLSQLAQASSVIVQGYIVSQQARWNASHTRIMTYTTVELDTAIKGSPPATLTIEQMGGSVGNYHVYVPGTAILQPQQEYVLFLEPVVGKAQTFHMVGMMQGAFRLYRPGNTAQRWVMLPLGSLSTGTTSKSLSQSPSLGEFRITISGVLAAPIVIPSGTSIPVQIESTQFQGTGQALVVARTTMALFPSKAVVIPLGSQVVGNAQQEGTKWKIYWNSVSVRGRRAHISAMNETAAGESLKGRTMVVRVR